MRIEILNIVIIMKNSFDFCLLKDVIFILCIILFSHHFQCMVRIIFFLSSITVYGRHILTMMWAEAVHRILCSDIRRR